jgi:pentatricopeptide repeat protein
MAGGAALACMKAGSGLVGQGRLQRLATYGSIDWIRDTPQENGRTHMRKSDTPSQAVAVLQNRVKKGVDTEFSTYIDVLQMCLKQKDLLAAKQAHDCINKSGMYKNPYAAGTLLNLYIKCGRMSEARRMFDNLENKSIIKFNAMIGGYANIGDLESAFELFSIMDQVGVRRNEVTYLCKLKACASPSALEWGRLVHSCIKSARFESDVRVGSALLHMYVKCGCMTEAREVFEKLSNRNIVTWNIMIGAMAANGRGMEAYELFVQMKSEGLQPNAVTYVNILNPTSASGAVDWVRKVHGHAVKVGLDTDLRVGNALIHMYGKCGNIDGARVVFERMKKVDVITWTDDWWACRKWVWR